MLLSSFAEPTIKGKKSIFIRTGFQHANILPLSAGFEKGIEPIKHCLKHLLRILIGTNDFDRQFTVTKTKDNTVYMKHVF